MFELLFSRPSAVKRHQDAPLAAERAAYLTKLIDQGSPLSVVRRAAFVCRWVAQRIRSWPPDRAICEEDLKMVAVSWARRRATNRRRAVPVPSPKESFRSTARGFLRDAGKWVAPAAVTGPCEDRIQAFLAAQQERGLAPATCTKRSGHARRFVGYLDQHDVALEQVRASHLDAYFQHLAASWCRLSMGTAAESLRAWVRYCEEKGDVRPGLAQAIMAPRSTDMRACRSVPPGSRFPLPFPGPRALNQRSFERGQSFSSRSMVFVPVSCAGCGSTISIGGRKRYAFSGPRVADGISIHLKQRSAMPSWTTCVMHVAPMVPATTRRDPASAWVWEAAASAVVWASV